MTGHPAPARTALGLPAIRLVPARALQAMRRAMELLLVAIPRAEAAATLRTAGRRTTALRTGPQMIRLQAVPVPTMLLTTVPRAALRTTRPMGLMPTTPQTKATVRQATLHPTMPDRVRMRRRAHRPAVAIKTDGTTTDTAKQDDETASKKEPSTTSSNGDEDASGDARDADPDAKKSSDEPSDGAAEDAGGRMPQTSDLVMFAGFAGASAATFGATFIAAGKLGLKRRKDDDAE